MTMPPSAPYAVFSGALGDAGGWRPAQAVVSDGMLTLWVAGLSGWMQHVTAPASAVRVKSAAQRITLVVHGQSYPILADPSAVGRALGYNAAGTIGGLVNAPGLSVGGDVGRGLNQAGAARAFQAQGGAEFLAAMRASGAQVSRLGFGALFAIGCGGALLVIALALIVTAAVLNG